jgi:hypothetical protein
MSPQKSRQAADLGSCSLAGLSEKVSEREESADDYKRRGEDADDHEAADKGR